jgi:hypothetical protein
MMAHPTGGTSRTSLATQLPQRSSQMLQTTTASMAARQKMTNQEYL